MSPINHESRVFASGERAAPGIYRDVESGAIVRLYETQELPDRTRIVHTARLFVRVEDAATETRGPVLAGVC